MHRASPHVALHAAGDATIFITQVDRHRARALVAGAGQVVGAHAVEQAAQIFGVRVFGEFDSWHVSEGKRARGKAQRAQGKGQRAKSKEQSSEMVMNSRTHDSRFTYRGCIFSGSKVKRLFLAWYALGYVRGCCAWVGVKQGKNTKRRKPRSAR